MNRLPFLPYFFLLSAVLIITAIWNLFSNTFGWWHKLLFFAISAVFLIIIVKPVFNRLKNVVSYKAKRVFTLIFTVLILILTSAMFFLEPETKGSQNVSKKKKRPSVSYQTKKVIPVRQAEYANITFLLIPYAKAYELTSSGSKDVLFSETHHHFMQVKAGQIEIRFESRYKKTELKFNFLPDISYQLKVDFRHDPPKHSIEVKP